MKTDCVSVLKAYALKDGTAREKKCRSSVYRTMSCLMRQGPQGDIMTYCLPHLLQAACRDIIQDEDIPSRVIALSAISDILPTGYGYGYGYG
jgi:hypothetical protein